MLPVRVRLTGPCCACYHDSMTREIILIPHRGTWYAEIVGDEEVYALWGTTVLPTPFTTAASVETVFAEIEACNPGVSVDYVESVDEWRASFANPAAASVRMAVLR